MEQVTSARGFPGTDSRREVRQQKIDLNYSTTSCISRAGPALKMLIVCITQVIVTILNPDPSLKSSNLGFVEGMNVKSQAPHITQVLPADRFKAIVSSIKGAIVHHQRFYGEAIHVEV